MNELLLARARAGDQDAFRALTDPHRRELQLHCYRMVGSLQDAEDVLQETLLAAWRGLGRFEGRSSLRAWLYRIATTRCLNALRDRARREPPRAPDPPFEPPPPSRRAAATWLQPYPDRLLDHVVDASPGPEARYEARESVELAFLTALQRLPPRQRAALLLKDVLGFHTTEVAAILASSETAVKGALQRARATLGERLPAAQREATPPPRSAQEHDLARRFADAFEADDIGRLVALLTEDAWLTMPPARFAYQGAAAIASFLDRSATWRNGRRFRLVPTRANTQPAFGLYVDVPAERGATGVGLIVLTVRGNRIAAITRFLDAGLLPHFGLPQRLPDVPDRQELRRPG